MIPTIEMALSSEFTFQYVKANGGVAVSGTKLFAGLENTHKIHPPQLVMCVYVYVCVLIEYLYCQDFKRVLVLDFAIGCEK